VFCLCASPQALPLHARISHQRLIVLKTLPFFETVHHPAINFVGYLPKTGVKSHQIFAITAPDVQGAELSEHPATMALPMSH
jgi:hypothetical protein